ncbi:VCBS repeat-containing protein [Jannaschia sp. M317]|uniref:FG-GAP repeat domain-containing protein n=1 Tax=Jannaschia sp. M317 TaxID=2867011 RepID=UPI0021A39842|nr:VCBS repeat-containing protein [Jannaschia sp. M317]UWQ18671.1 VCBS repeat-containing protein [Jannaschia sp. M317]
MHPWRAALRGAALSVACLAGGAGSALACGDAAQDALPGATDVQGAFVAWYADATTSYGHDIMGSVQDALTLRAVLNDDCRVLEVAAGAGHVFEDIAPRLTDVDGDGLPEVVAVRSSLTEGAQLIVYRAQGDALVPLAATPPIGRRNRWLAPAAWGDLDGDGAWEVAYVDRPHLAKTLRIWRLDGQTLREIAQLSGVTNHRIGEPFISGGLRVCGTEHEIVLASANWARRVIVKVAGEITAEDAGPWAPDTSLLCD